MAKQFEIYMFTNLRQALFKSDILEQFAISKRAWQLLLKEQDWPSIFKGLATKTDRYTCAEVLDLAQATMQKLSPTPKEGWLRFIYDYNRNILFPQPEFAKRVKEHGDAALFYLVLLQVLLNEEKNYIPFDWRMDFCFLNEDEYLNTDTADEYQLLINYWQQNFVYELLRLTGEVMPFCTLSHIAGVHHLAISCALDLKAAGASLDLALISGAALTHDIGKYGCKPHERVPYLHYYYSDLWCNQRALPTIGHIAANHSTWDLELELLRVESLFLIYADFRVREIIEEDQPRQMMILPLKNAFDAILNKLDSVDEEKLQRYEFVYAKLHDFEVYLRRRGVNVELNTKLRPILPLNDTALMDYNQVVAALKYLSIDHNISLMHHLGSERLFGNILEAARGEKNWKNIRAYLNIFEEYFAYLNQGQKVQTLSFLYELLMHREGDIRRAAAGLMGQIIANFNKGYIKQLPDSEQIHPAKELALNLWQKYLHKVIIPDHKLSNQHKSWVGYTLKIIISSVLEHCQPSERSIYIQPLMTYFTDTHSLHDTTSFVLLDAMTYLPLELCGEAELSRLSNFAIDTVNHPNLELRVAALRVLRRLAELVKDDNSSLPQRLQDFALNFDDQNIDALIFLKRRMLRALCIDDSCANERLDSGEIIADIFLDNLKTATPWIIKAINIKVLLDKIEKGNHEHLLHIAAHLSNLIKVSERVVVRHDAGQALLKIIPLLTIDQRNEIAVELTKGLEVGEYEFSKYIPEYLGQLLLYLSPEELDEMLKRINQLLSGNNERIISVALATIGMIVQAYDGYLARFNEPPAQYQRRLELLLGMILKSLASHHDTVRQEALLVLGKGIFGNNQISLNEKNNIFNLICKKMLFLIRENTEDELTFYYSSSALNHFYRFMALKSMDSSRFKQQPKRKIAFFPGTFDPFTLSHKGIVREILNLGFEVLLSLDEFSWSKKTQPRLIRRQIASISVADEFNVHIFDDSLPVNIANTDDLRRLYTALEGRDIYIVVGSDVVLNASAYAKPITDFSIHNWNHIIFSRASTTAWRPENHHAYQQIKGDIIELSLPMHLEDISSTRIRENIDNNRDISHLIDPAAQEFIYYHSLYLREPQYKPVLRSKAMQFKHLPDLDQSVIEQLLKQIDCYDHNFANIAANLAAGNNQALMISLDDNHQTPLGIIFMRIINSSDLYEQLHDLRLADLIRQKANGRILLISGALFCDDFEQDNNIQLLLNEALAMALTDNCIFGIYNPIANVLSSHLIQSNLEKQGFDKISGGHGLYIVNMHEPLVLIQNIETSIKEPLASNQQVIAATRKAHHRLQMALNNLFPGNLVLSLAASTIHQRLMEEITGINQVSMQQSMPRKLGNYMCVPFGKMLRGKVVPNTVTKTLHTDKVYSPDISQSAIKAYPYYSKLSNQIRTISSFQRQIILVDDILHAGDRMIALDPLFKAEDLDIKMVLVGVLSGYGRDLMAVKGYDVKGVYYVPTIKYWFVESTLYPFIGGDTIKREGLPIFGLLPSINMVLPYAAPFFAKDCSGQAIYDFSLTCLENARDLFLTLEAEYRNMFERNLSLSRLSEAIILPLCPDKGSCLSYDPSLSVSTYLENDIEMLIRNKNVIVRE